MEVITEVGMEVTMVVIMVGTDITIPIMEATTPTRAITSVINNPETETTTSKRGANNITVEVPDTPHQDHRYG